MLLLLAAFLSSASAVSGGVGDLLCAAIEEQDRARVLALLDEDPEAVNERDRDGSTPLHAAARAGAAEIAAVLLERGAVLTAMDRGALRPLHHVRDAEVARLFLAHGEDPRRRDGDYESPFERACRQNAVDAVGVYVDAGWPIGLADAVWLGMQDEVVRLLQAGVLPSGRGGEFSGVSRAPLNAAVETSNLAAARLLLEAGASLDRDLLNQAVRRSDDAMVELLLEHGARVEVEYDERYPRSLLAHAIGAAPREQALALCARAEDVDAELGGNELPALHQAAFHGRTELAMDLLELGASIERTIRGASPLRVACAAGRLDLARALVRRGALLDVPTAAALDEVDRLADLLGSNPELALAGDPMLGRPPAIWAAACGAARSLDLLLAHGATSEPAAFEEDPELLDPLASMAFPVRKCSPLHAAASAGRVGCIRLLIERGARIEALDELGRTPLSAAVGSDRDEAVAALLELGADPDGGRDAAIPPLVGAAARGRASLVALLLSAGADPDAVEHQGGSALEWAARHSGSREERGRGIEGPQAAQLLLASGARPSFAAACALGLVDEARAFLEDRPELATAKPPHRPLRGRSPLELAAGRGRIGIVAILHEAGVPVFSEASSALELAAEGDHVALVAWLLDEGASLEGREGRGYAPLHAAARGGAIEATRLLLERGADVAARTPRGETALVMACRGGLEPRGDRTDLVSILLAAGCDPAARTSTGWTALHGAAYHGQLGEVKRLLEAGAPLDVRDERGWTPLGAARWSGRDGGSREGRAAVIRFLRERGAPE